MAKKGLLVLILAAIVAGGAFAEMSVGGGVVYSGDFGGGVKLDPVKAEMPSNAFGAYGFFDIKYVEISAGILFGTTKLTMSYPGYSADLLDFSTTNFSLGLLGKFPIKVGEKVTLFPALGLDLQLCLSAEDEGVKADDPDKLNTIYVRFGGGIDFNLTDTLFIRGTILYGIRIQNELESDLADSMGSGAEANLGHGPAVKLAIGFKF